MKNVNEFIGTLESLMIVSEESEVKVFFNDPNEYLLVMNREWGFGRESGEFEMSTCLHTDGTITCNINKICNELVKVNAYTEALRIYEKAITIYTDCLKLIPNDETSMVQFTIDEFRSFMLNVTKQREVYTAKRKSVLSKYSDL